MTAQLLVLTALVGGVGATSRFLLDGVIRSRVGTAFPLGTVLINCSGSLVLGLLVGLADHAALADSVRLVVGTGFLGGFTTFSAASVETVALVAGRRRTLAIVNGFAVPVVAVFLSAAGLALGLAV